VLNSNKKHGDREKRKRICGREDFAEEIRKGHVSPKDWRNSKKKQQLGEREKSAECKHLKGLLLTDKMRVGQ